jgi:hypothetical protein
MRILTFILLLFLVHGSALAAAEQQPVVFKVQLTWEAKGPNGASSSGSAVGQFAPSSVWERYSGVNMHMVEVMSAKKAYNKTSPVAFYKELGSVAALPPGDRLQFVQSIYSGTGKTEKGCTFTQNDGGQGNVASIERDEHGALLTFCAACLEPGDTEDKCGYTSIFPMEFAPKDQEKIEKFSQFKLSEEDLKNFKNLNKSNSMVIETNPPDWKISVKATLMGQ